MRPLPERFSRIILASLSLSVLAPAQLTFALDKAVLTAALAAHDRSIAHLQRDESRKPIDVIEFLGINAGMQVLDVYAADGYYSYILSRVVGVTGIVYAQNPPPGSDVEDIRQMYSLADALDQQIDDAALTNVVHLREGFFDLSITPESLDVILLAQILHDFANSDRQFAAALLTHLGTLLKPGGTLAIIDHAGDAGQDNSRLHRMPEATAIELATQAGFALEASSEILVNVRDRRRRPVFDPMLGRNTDRFLLRFSKPVKLEPGN